MANPDLVNLFYCIITLFFLFRIIQFIVEIILYYKDKSLGNKINTREIIVSTWLLLPFIIAYGLTILLVKSCKELKISGFIVYNDYWMIFGFLIGLTFMISVFVITVNVKNGKRYVTATLNTDNLENLKSDHEADLMYNSTTNNDTTINTIIDVTNEYDKNQDNLEKHEINTLGKINNLNYSSRKTGRDAITPTLRKSSAVITNIINEDIISEKFLNIQKEHCIYCNFDDFKNLLSNIQLENKILFNDIDGKPSKFSKVDFLRILDDIVDGNIRNHPSNSKVEKWIEKSFDNCNISGMKISTIDISKHKKNSSIEV